MPYIFPARLALLSPMFPENILVVRKLLQKADFVKSRLFPSIQCVSGIWSHFSHSGLYPQCLESKPILLYMLCWWQLLMIFLIVVQVQFDSQWKPHRKHNWTPCQWQINCLKWKSAGVYVAKQENKMRWRKILQHCSASLSSATPAGILMPTDAYITFIWFFFLLWRGVK